MAPKRRRRWCWGLQLEASKEDSVHNSSKSPNLGRKNKWFVSILLMEYKPSTICLRIVAIEKQTALP